MSTEKKRPIPWGRQCKARSSRTGDRCRNPAINGALVCRHHGGSSPQVRDAAKRRVALARVEALALGNSRDVHPVEALMEQVHEAAGNVAMLRMIVQDEKHTVPMVDSHGKPHTNPALAFYNEERDRLARFSKLAVDAGVAEKQIRIVEEQAMYVAERIEQAMKDVGLTREQQDAVKKALAMRLRATG